MKKILWLSILIVILAAFFASANPDGLEKVAASLGFIESGVERGSVMTDYSVPFISQEQFSTALAGIIGIILCFTLFSLTAKLMSKQS